MAERRITGTTRVAGVIGHPVRHSLSPVILNAAFDAAGVDAAFFAFEVAPGAAADALAAVRTLELLGLLVTMPHKQSVAAAVTRCTPEAALLGAVNCVVVEPDGSLTGHSTDGAGLLDSLRLDAGLDVAGRSTVVLGAGGAARAVALALAGAGARVSLHNRTQERASEAAAKLGLRVADAGDLAGAELIVNATAAGMGTDTSMALDPALLHAGMTVVDIVYHPQVTPLLAAAGAAGATCVGGLGMLVHQAAHAFTLWTSREAPVAAMRAAAHDALGRDSR